MGTKILTVLCKNILCEGKYFLGTPRDFTTQPMLKKKFQIDFITLHYVIKLFSKNIIQLSYLKEFPNGCSVPMRYILGQ